METTKSRVVRASMPWIVAFSLLVATGAAFGRTASSPWRPPRAFDYRSYLKNQWRLPVTNYGTFGYGVSEGGGEWPAGSGDVYIYGAGIWIGSLKKTDTGRDTLVTIGYNPNSGKSEMSPGAYDNAPGGYAGRGFERVYVYPTDWPPNPVDFPEALQESVPTFLRVPPDTTRPVHFYYVPRSAVSSGDAWAVYNDRDPANHIAGTSPRPLGIEIYQSIYSWTLPWNKDIVFFKLDVRNRSDDTLRDVFLGMVCDADVGNAADDRCGLALDKYVYNNARSESAYVDNLGYVWSSDAVPAGFVGFDFLQSPYVRNPDGSIDGINGLDDNGNGMIDEPSEGRQYGMTAFKIFALANDPTTDAKQYLAMSGHEWEPPYEYNPYDSTDAAPDDKRFLQSTGPVTLAPGEMTTVTIAVIGARADRTGDPAAWPYQLAVTSQAAQQAYDNNWIMPEPPPNPNVTTIPGDGRVTLVWDDLPVTSRDRFFPLAATLSNPLYVEQDFQGYKVYRSRTGQPGDWRLLTQFDKMDGIIYEELSAVESLRTNARDAGLSYSYIDSSNLRLGFPYYYAVTAFDVNYLGVDTVNGIAVPGETLSLESGHSAVRAVPRTQAGNYQPPAASVEQVAGNPRLERNLRIEPLALVPHAVTEETYTIRFLGPDYDAALRRQRHGFVVTSSSGDTVAEPQSFTVKPDSATDTLRFVPTVFDSVITFVKQETVRVTAPNVEYDSVYSETTWAWLPIEQMTMKLGFDVVPTQIFDRVVVGGSYPQDSVTLRDDAGNNKTLWAYRGSRYRVVWVRMGGSSAMTCEVTDLDNNVAVPYRTMRNVTAPDSADGWSFQTVSTASDTLAAGQTRFFYLCGSRFQFRPGNAANPVLEFPTAGDTWLVYPKDLAPAPWFAGFDVTFKPSSFSAAARTLNVKVVPNPYVVRNEWERHRDFRKLKFINLPNKCTIWIYNLAGDLVKTLHHDDTSPNVGGQPNQYGGDEDWDVLNESRQKPAPGIYIFHVESEQGSQTGKFVLIY